MAESCGPKVTIYDPIEGPSQIGLPEFGDLVDELRNPPPANGNDPIQNPSDEVWEELSRETSEVQVGGVTIERIDSVLFKKPSGSRVVLKFNN